MSSTPVTTLYWRAIKRVERRSAAYRQSAAQSCGECTAEDLQLLAQACRAANRLADLAYGPARMSHRPMIA